MLLIKYAQNKMCPKIVLCRLCLCCHTEFKALVDQNGQFNEMYQVAVNYFDPKLLAKIICLECWHHINAFHAFQRMILDAHENYESVEETELDTMEVALIEQDGDDDLQHDIHTLTIESINTNVYNDNTTLDENKFNEEYLTIETVNSEEETVANDLGSIVYLNQHAQHEHENDDDSIICDNVNDKIPEALSQHAVTPQTDTDSYRCHLRDKFDESLTSLIEFEPDDTVDYDATVQMVEECSNNETSTINETSNEEIIDDDQWEKIALKKQHVVTNKRGKRKFKCSLCDAEYKYSQGLSQHMKNIHKIERKFKCVLCDTEYKYSEGLSEHMINVHRSEHKFQCTICDRSYKYAHGLREHAVTHIEQASVHHCPHCPTKFRRKTSIRRHIKNIHPEEFLESSSYLENIEMDDDSDSLINDNDDENDDVLASIKKHKHTQKTIEYDAFIAKWKQDLECGICQHTFTNFTLLHQHFKCQHPSDKCYIVCCEHKLSSRWQLVEHIQFHLDPNAFKCEICGKCSLDGPSLKNHMRRLHSEWGKERRFQCKVCQKRFVTKTELKVHSDIHNTDRNHICKICGKAFPSEQRLRKHGHNSHNARRLCDQCGKSCHGIYAYEQHMAEHAGIKIPKWPCNMCGAQLKSRLTLNQHKRTCHHDSSTVYICSECGKVSATKSALQLHKRNLHGGKRKPENKFRCAICYKGFKYHLLLREHTATHTGEALYQCPHCPITIKTNANLLRHIKNKHPKEFIESRDGRSTSRSKVDLSLVVHEIVI